MCIPTSKSRYCRNSGNKAKQAGPNWIVSGNGSSPPSSPRSGVCADSPRSLTHLAKSRRSGKADRYVSSRSMQRVGGEGRGVVVMMMRRRQKRVQSRRGLPHRQMPKAAICPCRIKKATVVKHQIGGGWSSRNECCLRPRGMIVRWFTTSCMMGLLSPGKMARREWLDVTAGTGWGRQ